MRVLKQGVLPGAREYIGMCTHCKAEVEFTKNEGTCGGQRDPGIYVKCPTAQCGGTIWGTEKRTVPPPSYYPKR